MIVILGEGVLVKNCTQIMEDLTSSFYTNKENESNFFYFVFGFMSFVFILSHSHRLPKCCMLSIHHNYIIIIASYVGLQKIVHCM